MCNILSFLFLVILLLVRFIFFTEDGDSVSPKRLFLFMHIYVNKDGFKILALVFNFVSRTCFTQFEPLLYNVFNYLVLPVLLSYIITILPLPCAFYSQVYSKCSL